MGAPYRNRNGFPPSKTICWECKHAVPDGKYGCSWSERLEPVEGWVTQWGSKAMQSYCVIECPEFIPDEEPPEQIGGVERG